MWVAPTDFLNIYSLPPANAGQKNLKKCCELVAYLTAVTVNNTKIYFAR